jgi:hypothetical protein
MKSELEVKINCKLIDPMVVDTNLELIKEMESLNKMLLTLTDEEKINEIRNKIQLMESDLITDEYNVAKYLESFNKKVEPLLVCFHPDIRNKILISIKKDKKTKLEKMTDKYIFTDEQCVLVSGMPNVSTDQDDYYEDLMKMEDKEIRFWDSVNKIPNNIDVNEWVSVRADYIVRMKEERERGIIFENKKLDEIFQRLEVVELNDIFDKKILPKADEILSIVTIDFEGNFISRKWGEKLCHLDDIFKYQNEAIQRNDWYQISNSNGENRYELWLEYKLEQSVDFNQNQDTELSSEEIKILKDNITEIEGKLKLKPAKVKQETDEDNEESDEYNPEELEPEIDNYTLELQKADFEIEVNSAPINASDVLNEINDDVDFVKNLLDEIKNGIDKEIDEWNF